MAQETFYSSIRWIRGALCMRFVQHEFTASFIFKFMRHMTFMNRNLTEREAMSLNKTPRPYSKAGPQPHPNYQDELSKEQIETIRKLADPDGRNAGGRVLLYPDAW